MLVNTVVVQEEERRKRNKLTLYVVLLLCVLKWQDLLARKLIEVEHTIPTSITTKVDVDKKSWWSLRSEG